MVLLPDVVMARFQHGHALYNAKRGALKPPILTASASVSAPLPPRPARGCAASSPMTTASISIRSTGSPSRTPMSPNTRTRPNGRRPASQIMQMLLDGELDAVLGENRPSGFEAAFADVAAEEKAWAARHRVVPINHMVVVSRALCEKSPDVVREVIGCWRSRPRHRSGAPRFSADEIRRSLELIIGYCAQQGLIPRAFSVDELFDDVTRAL